MLYEVYKDAKDGRTYVIISKAEVKDEGKAVVIANKHFKVKKSDLAIKVGMWYENKLYHQNYFRGRKVWAVCISR